MIAVTCLPRVWFSPLAVWVFDVDTLKRLVASQRFPGEWVISKSNVIIASAVFRLRATEHGLPCA